jgi:hypothetical protein
MNGTPTGAALERLRDERGPQLMRVAIALAGGRDAGEDLLPRKYTVLAGGV